LLRKDQIKKELENTAARVFKIFGIKWPNRVKGIFEKLKMTWEIAAVVVRIAAEWLGDAATALALVLLLPAHGNQLIFKSSSEDPYTEMQPRYNPTPPLAVRTLDKK
jgi:hypothetical protein